MRGAKNREEIVEKLKTTLGLNVQVLSREEEATLTFSAYRWAPPYSLTKNTLLLDQGGGSTELTLFTRGGQKIPFLNAEGGEVSTNIPVG